MSLDDHLFDFEMQTLFERSRAPEPLSDVVRARALARARAALKAAPIPAVTVPSSGRAPRWRLAVAAAGAFILGATGAATAFLGHAARTTATAPVERPAPPVFNVVIRSEPTAEPHGSLPAVPPRRHARASNASELGLLARAQAAYAAGDFVEVLDLVAVHARRFPNGQLAEEREALRVRSLIGCGRPVDARRAVSAFADRFPTSVLLPRLQGAVGRDD